MGGREQSQRGLPKGRGGRMLIEDGACHLRAGSFCFVPRQRGLRSPCARRWSLVLPFRKGSGSSSCRGRHSNNEASSQTSTAGRISDSPQSIELIKHTTRNRKVNDELRRLYTSPLRPGAADVLLRGDAGL